MNPETASIKEKFFCGCCAKSEDYNSDEAIFDYFGREFTEYEYVVENLAIRPAPKKLLDLVPVHSTNISCRTSTTENPSEPIQASSDNTIMSLHHQNQFPTGEGDFRKSFRSALIKDVSSDFISFKSLENDGPSIPHHQNAKPITKPPCCNAPPFSKDFPRSSAFRPGDHRCFKDINELRQSIKTKEYRTAKQVLSDLCEASEESLNIIKPTTLVKTVKPMPTEIKDTIDNLRFKKPRPNFILKPEKKLFHTPGVYFAEIQEDSWNRVKPKEESSTSLELMNRSNLRSQEPYTYSVDTTVQTEISKKCSCPKKEKKSLKWKIIINKHCDNKK